MGCASEQSHHKTFNVFQKTNLIQLADLFELRIRRPAVGGPFEPPFYYINEPGSVQCRPTLFPNVERLSPFAANLLYRAAPGIEEMVWPDGAIVTNLSVV